MTLEERGFPLAFSVLLYEEAEQAERLLRAVYRPHNVYCIHVDRWEGGEKGMSGVPGRGGGGLRRTARNRVRRGRGGGARRL